MCTVERTKCKRNTPIPSNFHSMSLARGRKFGFLVWRFFILFLKIILVVSQSMGNLDTNAI